MAAAIIVNPDLQGPKKIRYLSNKYFIKLFTLHHTCAVRFTLFNTNNFLSKNE